MARVESEGCGGTANPLTLQQLILTTLVGAAVPLAFAPFSYAWLMPVLLAVLMWQQYGRTPKQAFLLAVAFGTAAFVGGLYWIYISTHVYTGAPAALSVFLIFLLALYLSLYGAMAAAVAAWLSRRDGVTTHFYAWLLAYLCAWPLLELARNYVLTGFPWMALGYTQTDTWLNGWAPISGVFGLAVPVLLLAALPVAFKQGKVGPVMVLSLLFWGLGYWGQQQAWTTSSGADLSVGIAQGNIEQGEKWLPENRWPTAMRYAALTEQLLQSEVDIIVWPEVAIPGAYREFYPSLFLPLSEPLRANNTALLAGVMRWNDETQQYANAVLHTSPDGPEFYDKQHLVPFAEYFPVPGFVRGWLKSLELPFTDLYTGGKRQPFSVKGQGIATSICFEDVFAEEVAMAAANANVLVNVSNDAWFGRSIAAAQHEQIARMRSIETRRWMVRATPTGYSAFIDAFGRITQRLPRAEVSTAIAAVKPLQGKTPYMNVRNWWMLGLLFMLLALLGVKLANERRLGR